MKRRYFGTDGIRAEANSGAMTPEMVLRFAIATARCFASNEQEPIIAIGRDTRVSGGMIESALMAGFTAMGYRVHRLGVVPTPAVAMATRKMKARFGVMISASHNPYQDNGLKVFNGAGEKLSDGDELVIESQMDTALDGPLAPASGLGFVIPINEAADLYIQELVASFGGRRLDGLKIVLDCAHGAAITTAPQILQRLGAMPTLIGYAPTGTNINDGVGSTHPGALKAAVLENGADIGIALDGDADRLIVVDEAGTEIDGDQIMALIATDMYSRGTLKGGGIVSTVMSNMGLAQHLKTLGLTLSRTGVGDRYVAEHMRANGFNLGGEPSGHLILSDVSTTGDGMLAALAVLSVLKERGQPMSALGRVFTPAPQKMINIRYSGADPLEAGSVKAAIAGAEAALGERGRMVVRKSGTEPLVRVMAEALDPDEMDRALAHVVQAVEAVA